MPRRPFIQNPTSHFHITVRCINREWFCDLEETWNIFGNQLWFAHHAFGLEITSFVLMSNHLHLIARAPLGNLSVAMRYFLAECSRQIQKSSGRTNQIFAERFRRCEIKDFQYLLNAYKYVYRNPVRAGVTSWVEDYRYSTLRGLLGMQPTIIPVCLDNILFEDPVRTLQWLNDWPRAQDEETVRKALRRSVFEFPKKKDRSGRRASVRL